MAEVTPELPLGIGLHTDRTDDRCGYRRYFGCNRDLLNIQHVKRARRADAKTALLNDAQFLERNFTEANAYNKDANGASITDSNLPNGKSPADGAAVYTISATTLTATTYTLTATPVVGGPMAGDACGNLTLNYLGVKGVGGSTVARVLGQIGSIKARR